MTSSSDSLWSIESTLPPETCPLCRGISTVRVCELEVDLLWRAYRQEYGLNLGAADLDRIDYRRCSDCDLRYFHPAVCGNAAFYRDLQRIAWYYREDKPEYQLARPHIKPSDAVLEVGAGKAAFARGLQCASYVGLEMSPEAIETARSAGVSLLHEDVGTHARRHAQSYDVVCAFQVLEHVSDPRSFLQEMGQCLRRGGRMLIAVPSEDSFAAISYWDLLNMPPHHVTRWSDRCLRAAASLLDLECVAIEHEPLEQGHARLFARYAAEYALARKAGREPVLLDSFVRRRWVRAVSQLLASVMKHAFMRAELKPVGHSVLAVFRAR